ncbi:35183_t:CDS:2 [Gigaspora margarita]|uniref:35183_t:CDS:1 n=1 Tax=Gigaspora margarita TaxID=4874 RepID=A0ABN7W1G0_GIGMA|nr:35183_t:CDS:2 [Gigaspora margarita]
MSIDLKKLSFDLRKLSIDKLSQDYQSLLESSEFYDILIQVGKKSNKEFFKAHYLILRTHSPYFQEVLSKYGDKLPKNAILFDKPNVYVYNGTVDIELEFKEIIYLLWGAQVLCFKELCDYIENIIIEQTDLLKKHISLINRKGLSIKWINDISNLNPPSFYTFNLLQQASRHGSSSKKFHDQCDGKDNLIVSKVIDTKYAIKQNKYTGPTFGKSDLKICGELEKNEKSRCRKGSYKKPIRDSKDFFCVDDYEVFQVFEKPLNYIFVMK